MTNLSTIRKRAFISIFLASALSGCGSSSEETSPSGEAEPTLNTTPSSTESSGRVETEPSTPIPSNNSSSSNKKLNITQVGNNFNIVWNKQYVGYSEVVYMDEVKEGVRGSNIMHDNSTGKHTLDCTLSDNSTNRVSYSCEGSGPSILGGEMDLNARLSFKKGVQYKILTNYSFDLTHSEVNYILEFNGNTLSIH